MNRPTREELLVAARASAHFEDERQRRMTVLGLFRRAVEWREPGQPPLVSESDFLDEAYGDQKTYWKSWRDAAEADDLLAPFLAVHVAYERCARDWNAFDEFKINPSWLIQNKAKGALEALARTSAGPLVERLRELVRNSNTRHLICASLQAVLTPAEAAAPDAIAAETPPKSPWRHRRLDKPRPERAEVTRTNSYRRQPHDGAMARPPTPPSEAGPKPTRANAPKADLVKYLKTTASKDHTKPELKTLAQRHFKPRLVTDALFETAYKDLSPDQKRAPGETSRKLAADAKAG
jgi:hypothetical protein